ncbi:hypothetical protein [Trinickia symbiotica]|uniref:hypothetical protein n=1 Tax=Trinickia symbiotica TaxID=863227 RepID=UPI00131ADD92|nr:hypothetical protein [Trinickia symbiotica]
MGIAVGETGQAVLKGPRLPQAEQQAGGTYRLDLGSEAVASAGAVEIRVPRYSERSLGDSITVVFDRVDAQANEGLAHKIHRYRYLADPRADPPDYEYSVFLQPLQSLPSCEYEVFYMVTSRSGNSSLSERVPVEVVGTPGAAGWVFQAGFYGTYVPGVIASGVVANERTLAPNDFIIRSIGDKRSDSNVTLGVYRTPPNAGDQLFANFSSADGAHWTPDRNGTMQFERSDLVTVRLENQKDAAIYVALAM